ncbi:MAG: DUF1634 domain-containing protein [Tepidisphaeraceae bacterium]
MSDPNDAKRPETSDTDAPASIPKFGPMPVGGDRPLIEPVTGRPDERASRMVELIISLTLRVGVIASLLIILAGVLIGFVNNPLYRTSEKELTRITDPHAPVIHTAGEIWTGLKEGRGQAVIAVGLVVLLATPILRVAISIVAFLVERDVKFAIITAAVLLFLLLSFVLGAVG